MGTFFRIRERYGSERRGLDSAFHLLCQRYSGSLTPTASMAMSYGKPLPFFLLNILAQTKKNQKLCEAMHCAKQCPLSTLYTPGSEVIIKFMLYSAEHEIFRAHKS